MVAKDRYNREVEFHLIPKRKDQEEVLLILT